MYLCRGTQVIRPQTISQSLAKRTSKMPSWSQTSKKTATCRFIFISRIARDCAIIALVTRMQCRKRKM